MFVSWFFCVILLWLIIAAAKVGECTYIVNKLPVNIFKMTRNKSSPIIRLPATPYKLQTFRWLFMRFTDALPQLLLVSPPLLLCAALAAMSCRARKLWASESFVLVLSAETHSAWNRGLSRIYSRHWGLAWEEQTHSRQNRNPTTYPLEFKTWNLNSHEDHILQTLEFLNSNLGN